MAELPPYLPSAGTIETVLKKMQPAKTPESFDAKFLEDTLGLSGGGPRSFIPFAKRVGLVSPDGTPTELYNQFRGEGSKSKAIAKAMRIGYAQLFDRNENAHELPPDQLKALVIQVTGRESDSTVVKTVVACFSKLNEFADFSGSNGGGAAAGEEDHEEEALRPDSKSRSKSFNIAYTINLNLPESTNPAVFNAIFKSLREHLLRGG